MDNDPSQRSVAARKAIKKECCELFCIPARSPDLNPIKNMFHIAKKSSSDKLEICKLYETWQEFKSRVVGALRGIPVDYVDNIITSMPKRINAVLQRNGYRTLTSYYGNICKTRFRLNDSHIRYCSTFHDI